MATILLRPKTVRLRLNRNVDKVASSGTWEKLKEAYGLNYIFIGTLKETGMPGYNVEEAKKLGVYASLVGLDSGVGIFEIIKDTQLELDF